MNWRFCAVLSSTWPIIAISAAWSYMVRLPPPTSMLTLASAPSPSPTTSPSPVTETGPGPDQVSMLLPFSMLTKLAGGLGTALQMQGAPPRSSRSSRSSPTLQACDPASLRPCKPSALQDCKPMQRRAHLLYSKGREGLSLRPRLHAGTAIAFLLVFRTDNAYRRLAEARECWARVVYLCRELVIKSVVVLDYEVVCDISRYLCVPRLGSRLRVGRDPPWPHPGPTWPT